MIKEIKLSSDLIKKSSYIVAFTGAGISVESGIPDFRSKGGLWERFDPNEYAEYSSFLTHPEKFWTMHAELSEMLSSAEPNPAHLSLAKLEALGRLKTVITQNIDFLHQRAGNTKVLEVHGTGETATCLSCKKGYDRHTVEEKAKNTRVPRCDKCDGLIKPDVVLFSEPLPYDVFEEAKIELAKSDLVIVIGSSLSVYPAMALPSIAYQNSIPIIIVNDEPTPLDDLATVIVRGRAGELLPKMIQNLEE
jgi:NAD-dependent deacetylase